MANKEDRQDFRSVLKALNSLQSNADVIKSWAKERLENRNVDLIHEMEEHLRRLNIHMEDMSVIHVAGTKGKGSVCSFAESILRKCGYKTGLYTSPHLVSVRERIRINGAPISTSLFSHYFWKVWDGLHNTQTETNAEMPPYFRFLTLLAFEVFISEKVDVAIIEVGVGGRTDATNVVKPVVCGVTSIGYDHMNVLGNTLTEIAREKAGIFKIGIPAFTIPQTEEAMNSLKEQSLIRRKEPLEVVDVNTFPKLNHANIGIGGEHQKNNAALAIALVKTWLDSHNLGKSKKKKRENWEEISPEFLEGIQETSWLGRSQLHVLEEGKINLWLDGAHTMESLSACVKWYQKSIDGSKNSNFRILVFNCHTSRNPKKLLESMVSDYDFDEAIFNSNETGIPHILEDKRIAQDSNDKWQNKILEEYQEFGKTNGFALDTIPETIQKLKEMSKKHPDQIIQVLVTGSLYHVGAWLEVLMPEMRDNI